MNIKSVLGTAAVVGALLMSAYSLERGVPNIEVNVPPSNPTPVQVINKVETPSVNVAPARVTVESPRTTPAPVTLGAVSGPDLYSPYWNVNDVRSWYYSAGMVQASTTCSFKAPNSTTTVLKAALRIDRISSSTDAEIGMSTSPNATTTLISPSMTGSILASTAQHSVVASSTAIQLVVPPNYYINYKVGGLATAGTVTPVGKCSLVLVEM